MIARRTLTIALQGPVLTRSNTVGGFGVDAPMAQLPDGRFYLPGTLVAGRLAEAFRQLGGAQREAGSKATFLDDLANFFATGETDAASGDAKTGRDRRRRLSVGDLVSPGVSNSRVRTRIAIDSVTGAVQDGMLQVIAAPHAAFETVVFAGEVRVTGTTAEADGFLQRLGIALDWIAQWGGLRSVGHGVAKEAKLGAAPALPAIPAFTQPPARLLLRLQVMDPLCIGEQRVADNIYESGPVVPGGAIKGAIASQMLASAGLSAGDFLADKAGQFTDPALKALATHFSALRFRHAMPAKDDDVARRHRPPLSFVADGDNKLYDLALAPDPKAACLLNGKAPAFAPDWKDKVRVDADKLTGWSEPALELRIRTKINQERRASETGNLFGIGYLQPDTHVHIGEVDLGGVSETDRAAVAEGLRLALAGGLAGLGRGGAFAVAGLEPATAADEVAFHPDGRLVLVLRTPALLRKPVAGATGDVTADYRAAFESIGGNGLRLSAIFIRERLAGAAFMAARLPGGAVYRPFLLTEAGSVFVFETPDRDLARRTVAGWLGRGLDIPNEVLTFHGLAGATDVWKFCPFARENGYGEIGLRGPVAADEKWAAVPDATAWQKVAALEPAGEAA